MAGKDIVVVGASAGGIDALQKLAAALPADFAGSVFIVVHIAPDSPGVLADIIDAAGPLPATKAVHDERIRPGHIYVAPADAHLIIERDRVKLTRGPKENRFRPAIDPLFRSAAQTYGPRVVGVVLTGGLDDGTNGLWTIKQLGGTAIVQDPEEAIASSMPLSALRHVRVDHTVRIAELAPLLVRLAAMPADAQPGDAFVTERVNIEVNIAKEENPKDVGVFKLGEPSKYACPECHGVLLQVDGDAPLRFRCHTGHAYTTESLFSEMDEVIEDSLWSAIRAIEERVMLMHQTGSEGTAEEQQRADLVRKAVMTKSEEKQKK